MKTHELAEIFEKVAKILKDSPDVEVKSLPKIITSKKHEVSTESTELGLKTLAQLSKIDKPQWISLINKFQLDVRLNPRDSSRDVLGKILRHLSSNEQAYQEFEKKLTKTTSTSEPLENILKLLLTKD